MSFHQPQKRTRHENVHKNLTEHALGFSVCDEAVMEELKPLEEQLEGYIVTPGGPEQFPDNILFGITDIFESWNCQIFQIKLNLFMFLFVCLEVITKHFNNEFSFKNIST